MISEVVQEALCPDKEEAARLKEQLEKAGLSIGKISREIDESPSTISEVLAGKYNGAEARKRRVMDKIARHLDVTAARSRTPQNPDFVWTAVAREIETVAMTAVLHQGIAVVMAPVGSGKTSAMRALLDRVPGSMYLECQEGLTSLQFRRRLHHAESGRAELLSRDRLWIELETRLAGTRRLIMVDEIHLANRGVLGAIKSLHDSTGCPFLLAGLSSIKARLERDRSDDGLGSAFYGRVTRWANLEADFRAKGGGKGNPMFTVDDIRQVFSDDRLPLASDTQEYLCDLANHPGAGGLRAIASVLRSVRHTIQAKNQPFDRINRQMFEIMWHKNRGDLPARLDVAGSESRVHRAVAGGR